MGERASCVSQEHFLSRAVNALREREREREYIFQEAGINIIHTLNTLKTLHGSRTGCYRTKESSRRRNGGWTDRLTDARARTNTEEKQTPISSYDEERLSVLSIPDHNPDRILGTPFPLRLPESHYQNCWNARRERGRRRRGRPQTISRRCTS